MEDILKDLDEQQLQAVTHGKGPLIVIAGAGTGKTKVITHRIAWLIAEKKAKPEEILGLTFTDKAANEMEERVDLLVPYGFVNVQICTFHAFGQKLLREYGLEIGIDPDFRILSTPEVLVFLKDHLFEFPLSYYRPLGSPTKYLSALVDTISRAKDEDISVEEYLAYATKLKERSDKNTSDESLKEEAAKAMEVAQCYQKYESLLLESGYIDIASLITLTLKLLRERPLILKKLQSTFKYILVDEFQDTNYAQFQLVQLIAKPNNNITVVGDDDQSIYKFRGAAITNILSFMDIYPDAKEIVLNRNYRSAQTILNTAYRLISFNNPNRLEVKRNIDKRIYSTKGGDTPVRYFHYDTISSEADKVAEMIEERMSKGGYSYNDFAILVRTNSSADPFIRALNMRGIPWRFSGNQGLYDREEIKTLINLLNVIRNPADTPSLYGLASSHIYALNPMDLSKCLGYTRKTGHSLIWVFEHLDEVEDISAEGKATIEKILQDIMELTNLSASLPTGRVLYEFLNRTGWLKRLTLEASIQNEIKIKNIAEFLEIVQKIGSIIKRDEVPFVADYIESLKEMGDNPPVAEADFDVDAVNVLTIHKAKGLEFRVVFLSALVDQIFPHKKMPKLVELPLDLVKEPIPEGDFHIEEERRLFYVGITRAKEELILTSSRDLGGKRPRKVSQFVIEALDLKKEEIIPEKVESLERIERFKHIHEKEGKYVTREGMLTLSSLQVDDYLTCPLKYKYIHVLAVPIPKHHSIVYGNAVHTAIAAYWKAKKAGNKFGIEDLIKVFEDAWVSEGFISREHEERRFNAGKQALQRFFEISEKEGEVPDLVEEWFSFILDDIKVMGRWDRVDMLEEGGRIIDYKTGEVTSKEAADRRAGDNIQLPIYALAYKERFGAFPKIVELHFVDTEVVGELKGLDKKVEKAKEKIREVAQKVRAREFAAKPSYMACQYCSYRGICPYKAD